MTTCDEITLAAATIEMRRVSRATYGRALAIAGRSGGARLITFVTKGLFPDKGVPPYGIVGWRIEGGAPWLIRFAG